MMKPHPNPCPKADRCIHAAECICYDTFRGEYLCFDSRTYSNYEAKGAAAKKALDTSLACSYELGVVKKLSALTDRIAGKVEELEDTLLYLQKAEDVMAQSAMIRDSVLVKMGELRVACDEAETLTAKNWWPYPSYADLLFSVQ